MCDGLRRVLTQKVRWTLLSKQTVRNGFLFLSFEFLIFMSLFASSSSAPSSSASSLSSSFGRSPLSRLITIIWKVIKVVANGRSCDDGGGGGGGKRKILFHSIRTFMALTAMVNWASGDGYEIHSHRNTFPSPHTHGRGEIIRSIQVYTLIKSLRSCVISFYDFRSFRLFHFMLRQFTHSNQNDTKEYKWNFLVLFLCVCVCLL